MKAAPVYESEYIGYNNTVYHSQFNFTKGYFSFLFLISAVMNTTQNLGPTKKVNRGCQKKNVTSQLFTRILI